MNGVQNVAYEGGEEVEIQMEGRVSPESPPPTYDYDDVATIETTSIKSSGDYETCTVVPARGSAETERRPAVTVRGAYKSFGKSTRVLNNFNMTVTEGTIYSLLGSSGCGKTTILSAIVGIRSLDKGEIKVFGQKTGTPQSGIPGRCVGHMPQDYALYSEFSVEESLQYYGFIYGMTKSQIKERSEYLIKFLNLPKPTQKVGTLSGGQKRRVSLAIALCHEPKLLILDEPTVGVDHLLRESIWVQLRNLVADGKTTVIITTHYIEESRGSDTIGLMRNGRLLTEKSPLDLLREHNVTLLEDVVLNLSRYDSEIDTCDDTNKNHQNVTSEKNNGEEVVETPTYTNDTKDLSLNEQYHTASFSFSRLRSLLQKNMILLFRNFLFLLFNFFSPSLQIVVCCLAIGGMPMYLKFGVVNYENPSGCSTYEDTEDCVAENLSCSFMNKLPKGNFLELVPYENEEAALRSVEKGHTWGYMSFPANFSASLLDRMTSGQYTSNESLEGSTITFQLDMSSQTIGSVLERAVFTTFPIFASSILENCGNDPRVGQMPIKFKDAVYGSPDTAFREFLAPSVLLGLLFFFPLCSSGIVYISEKKAGTLDRSLVAGVTTLEIMLSNLVSQTFVLLVQTGFAFIMLTQVFNIPIQGSVLGALSIAILIGISGMSMGFLISTFCEEEIHAVLLAIGTFFPNFLLAGMVWPIEGMPLFLRYFGYLLPCTLACESIRSIISRGWSVFHYRVWPGFVSTIAWICLYWLLTIFIHKKFQGKK